LNQTGRTLGGGDSLSSLINEAWRLFTALRPVKCVVRRSVPILYFGDLPAYFKSRTRVVTVGLNPSSAEFPAEDPFERFPQSRSVRAPLDADDRRRYAKSLDRYFQEKPYKRWFASFEPLLGGLRGSFYPGSRNTVLHTDLCSPIATNPTWSQLDDEVKQKLISGGRQLWRRLIAFLEPDLIIASVARYHVEELLSTGLRMKRIFTIRRANPYHFESCVLGLSARASSRLVFGRAANTPFGTVSNEDKAKFGIHLFRSYCK
jgi:hypothetical protein